MAEDPRRANEYPPSPGTPGEASGLSDCPRAGRGEGSSSEISNLRFPKKTLTPTLSRSTGRGGKGTLLSLIVFLTTAGAIAQDTSPLPDPIPRQQLEQIYRHELEGLYRPADAEKVFGAHQLLERYFATGQAAE